MTTDFLTFWCWHVGRVPVTPNNRTIRHDVAVSPYIIGRVRDEGKGYRPERRAFQPEADAYAPQSRRTGTPGSAPGPTTRSS